LRTKALIIPYEQIDRRPWLAVWRISRAICPIVYPSEILAITHRLSKATVKRQSAEQRLSPERLETIRAALSAAIMAAGLSQFG
jgi:hypothetical protein